MTQSQGGEGKPCFFKFSELSLPYLTAVTVSCTHPTDVYPQPVWSEGSEWAAWLTSCSVEVSRSLLGVALPPKVCPYFSSLALSPHLMHFMSEVSQSSLGLGRPPPRLRLRSSSSKYVRLEQANCRGGNKKLLGSHLVNCIPILKRLPFSPISSILSI